MIIAPNSASATSMKALKPITDLPYLNNDQISDIALSGKNIFLTGTTESPNSNWITGLLGGSSDGFLISYAVTGVQNWGLTCKINRPRKFSPGLTTSFINGLLISNAAKSRI